MIHSALSSQINVNSRLTAAQRHEASRLIISGRKLRKDGRELRDSNKVKAERLIAQGWCRHTAGIDLLDQAEDSRNERRHAHLAAALLNGKTYEQCESKRNPHKTPDADFTVIGGYIRPHLPAGEQKHSEAIAQAWLKSGNLRLSYIQDKGIAGLVALDQKRSEIAKLKGEFDEQTRRCGIASSALRAAQKTVERRQADYDASAARVRVANEAWWAAKRELEEAQEAEDTRPTDGIADLFRQAS
jgi:hypothetical protein